MCGKFNYLGSSRQKNKGYSEYIIFNVKAKWLKFRSILRVLSDEEIS